MLVDSPGADIGGYEVNRVCGDNNILGVDFEDFRDRTGIFIFTLDKEFFIVGSHTDKARFLQ